MSISYLAKNAKDFGAAFSPERIKEALEVTILGLIAIFAVLTLIWFVLIISKKLIVGSSNNKSDKMELPKPDVQPINQDISTAPVVKSNDDVTIAVITAAISAYISENEGLSEQYQNGFRVVSFKRVREKATWNLKK